MLSEAVKRHVRLPMEMLGTVVVLLLWERAGAL